MNALEEIQTAIETLTELRNEPEPPYYDRWNIDDFTYGNLDDAVDEGFEYGAAYGRWSATHRTIDAQLGILTVALAYEKRNIGTGSAEDFQRKVLTLARAINGTPA